MSCPIESPLMDFVERTLQWQRRTLAAVLVLTALAFHRGTFDVFNTTKATVIAVGTTAIVAAGVVRVARTRRALLPVTRAWWATGAFLGALAVSTVVSPTPLWSVVGRPGRHTGLAMYVLCAVLLLVTVRLYRDSSPVHLVKALLGAALPVSLYGLGQAAGFEPFGWNALEGGPQVFATFGNANFFSAWLGIVTPLGVWAALARTLPWGWRATGGTVAVLAMAACLVSDSLQGPGAAMLGMMLVGGVWLFTEGGAVRRWRRPLLAGGLGGVGVLAAGLTTGAGPFAAVRQGAQASLSSRLPKWEAALAMARDRPLLGVGLDNYANWYPFYRSEAVAAQDGLQRSVDSSHNVALDMLTSGGVPLLATYAAVVVVTAWALIVGLRRLQGPERLLLAGLGGAWVAYQAQSLVSIDVPPLAVLHWVLAGVIIARGACPPLREWVLPGAPPIPTTRPGRKQKVRVPAVPLARAHPAVLGGLGVVVLTALWAGTLPVRADAAAMRGVHLGAAGDTRGATDSYRRAGTLGRWEPRYPSMLGGALHQVGRAEQAYDAYLEAAQRDPRDLANALNLARVAVSADRHDDAARWYARALEIDPTTPEVLAEVGRNRLDQGDIAGANGLLERAVTLRGDQANWWVTLGQVRSAEGDEPGARAAFERALELDPEQHEAAEELERLALGPSGQA
ncbi:hypothetical protein BH23ACT9_BH23ACT9_32460 [soil metagenome]